MNITYHLKLVYRSFINQRPYSFLNLIGLSIGLCISFIALQYITQETGWDAFHKNSKKTYRILLQNSFDNEKTRTINVAIANRFKEEIPEINNMFVFHPNRLKVKDSIIENEMIGASPEMLNMLSFNIIEGGIDSFKTDLKTIIISEATAKKYFGKIAVTGKTLSISPNNNFNKEPDYGPKADYTIGAVYKDFPEKSFFKPTLIIPIENSKRYHSEKKMLFQGNGYQTFLSLTNNAMAEEVLEKINKIGNEVDKKYNGKGTIYSLQAIEDIHLFSDDVNEPHKASIKNIWFYSIIGILALTISLLNFLLLYTAITKRRFKEFSIHRVHGLKKKGLLKLFFFESLTISIISSIIAVFLMKIATPLFNEFTGSKLVSNGLENYQFVLLSCLLIVCISIIAGIYFTFYAWRHNTIEILSNNNSKKGANFFFKNGAIVTQIGIVSFMLVFTMGVYAQLDFMIHSDKGYSTKNLINLNIPTSKYEGFIQELLRYPIIESVALGYSLPSSSRSTTTVTTMVNGEPKSVKVNQNIVDENYISMYQLKIIKGQNFNTNDTRKQVILNETAVKYLGLGDSTIIGRNLFVGNVVGVIKDFHYSSFHKKIEPYVLIKNKVRKSSYDFGKYITVKYKSGAYKNTLQLINKIKEENEISQISPVQDIDSKIEYLYRKERTLQKAILMLTAIIIFITVLGLIGMSLFKTEQSTKEIGIRKVNGATITEILLMLNKDFIKWVFIAFIIACPIAYYAMHKWLENFAYKTSLSWWVFALAGVFTLVIALVTVSWQSYRAATRNPVESLRDE